MREILRWIHTENERLGSTHSPKRDTIPDNVYCTSRKRNSSWIDWQFATE